MFYLTLKLDMFNCLGQKQANPASLGPTTPAELIQSGWCPTTTTTTVGTPKNPKDSAQRRETKFGVLPGMEGHGSTATSQSAKTLKKFR